SYQTAPSRGSHSTPMGRGVNENRGKVIFYQIFSVGEGRRGGDPEAGFSQLWITEATVFCITMERFSAAISGGFRW
ncbi:hypothetical protein, partial [Pseudomonas nitroreducens]|uniref:hypothetical protein n=1 Tax=Pseudomonas nitroreducens TaxID=46680 RepID=UPI001F359291